MENIPDTLIEEIIRRYIKENLTIEITKVYDHYDSYHKVTLSLNGGVFSEDYISND